MERLQIIRDTQTFEAVSVLDELCFGDNGFQYVEKYPHHFGDIYAYRDTDTLIGYAIFGQVWLPKCSDVYISRIGVHPDHRQNGCGLKILNAVLAEIPTYLIVCADIRQSNIASQCLFRKAGFCVQCELDGTYPDEIGIRVIKTPKPMEVSP